TTLARPLLKSRYRDEQGGLSGAPLRGLAIGQLREFRRIVGSDLPLISAGGIGSAEDAWQRILAGASLVQLYSAMVYDGPGLAFRIAQGLAERARAAGYSSISEAVGQE
ncbi:MAG: dihydroorotate dehydrogenase (quinone), partial [Sphingomicrobium sp.]